MAGSQTQNFFFTLQIVTHQHRILMILDGLSIGIEEVDISAPGMEEARDFMRANGKKKEGERHVLPPQIFNGDKYCGVISILKLLSDDVILNQQVCCLFRYFYTK